MKSRSALRAATVFFVVLVFAIRVFADDVPTFRDPYVNTFVKSWSQFVHDSVEALKDGDWYAEGHAYGDRSKAQAIESRGEELQTQLEHVAGKVKPDEKQKFEEYIIRGEQKILLEQETCLKKSLEKP
jgi:hypothetical protein